jgi:hypothetical protein
MKVFNNKHEKLANEVVSYLEDEIIAAREPLIGNYFVEDGGDGGDEEDEGDEGEKNDNSLGSNELVQRLSDREKKKVIPFSAGNEFRRGSTSTAKKRKYPSIKDQEPPSINLVDDDEAYNKIVGQNQGMIGYLSYCSFQVVRKF